MFHLLETAIIGQFVELTVGICLHLHDNSLTHSVYLTTTSTHLTHFPLYGHKPVEWLSP